MRETKTPTRPNTTMTGALFAVLRREDWIVNSQCVTLITKVGCTISLRQESYSYGHRWLFGFLTIKLTLALKNDWQVSKCLEGNILLADPMLVYHHI